jgi:4-hydroxy-2-oxoheptanedioate aldolase
VSVPVNTFKARLRAPGAQIGLWLGLADPYAADIVGGAGFDWLLIDGEHAPNDVRSVLAQLQVLAPHRSHPVVRAPIGDAVVIKQLLDIGAQTVLVPMVESAEQAQALVQATRYPPAGVRGVAGALVRASGFNRRRDYLHAADEQVCLLVQVETRRGLDAVDAIAATEGVDGVFVGPADLAASLGHLSQSGHPEVQAAIDHVIDRVRAADKAPGILTLDVEQAHRYIARGCRFVAVGTDVTVLVRGTDALVAAFRADASAADVVPPAGGGQPS